MDHNSNTASNGEILVEIGKLINIGQTTQRDISDIKMASSALALQVTDLTIRMTKNETKVATLEAVEVDVARRRFTFLQASGIALGAIVATISIYSFVERIILG